jgi:hypothetical protein
MEQLMGGYVKMKFVRADYIPAQPSYFRLVAWLGEGCVEVEKEAIVAWRIRTYAPVGKDDDAYTTCDPIVPQESIEDNDAHAILRPDGMVQSFEECVVPFEKWQEREFKRLSELEKRREANAANTA